MSILYPLVFLGYNLKVSFVLFLKF